MSSSKSLEKGKESKPIFTQSWATTWRKALISAPRLVPDAALRLTSPEGPHPKVLKIQSRNQHRIPIYMFIPPPTDGKRQTSYPVLLDFHGGGFVQGSCLEQAPFCAKLCRELNCIAISVDYRLGPYAQFPAALEDAEDVLRTILDPTSNGHQHILQTIRSNTQPINPTTSQITLDTTRLALSGFSSGGNLALNLVLDMPTAIPPLLATPWPSALPPTHARAVPLLLYFPSLDSRLLPHERPLPPGLTPPSGLLAALNLEADLIPSYLPRSLISHPRASPALAPLSDNALHPSATVLLLLPEFDAITPITKLWVDHVQTEGRGGDLEVLDVPGMLHGWTQYPDGWLDEIARRKKAECFDKAMEFVRRKWAMDG